MDLHPGRGGGVGQSDNNKGRGKMLYSAYVFKVPPTELAKGWKMCSVKNQIVNVLDFAGHLVPVATTQLCCWIMNAAIDTVPCIDEWA